MARKRMIDPSIWTDEGMAALTPRQQVLYIGLVSNADDEGRLKGSAVAVRLMLPAIFDGVRVAEVDADLSAVLAQMTKLVRYQTNGYTYLCFRNYSDWQNINRPTPSRLPPPPDEPSLSTHASLTEPSLSTHSQEKGIEEKGIEEKDSVVSARDKPAPVRSVAFDVFWQAYPRKERRPDAIRAWNKLRPPPDECDAIMAGLMRWQLSEQWARGIRPHAATWLNGRQWEDEPEPAKNGRHDEPQQEAGAMAWIRRQEAKASTTKHATT